MILLLDIGNSFLKWACLEQGQLGPSTAIKLGDGEISDSLAKSMAMLDTPDEIWMANVAGINLAAAVTDWVATRWGCSLHQVIPSSHVCGITNGYIKPQQLGVDRWLGLIAAYTPGQPGCVVSCGTAVTIDVIDKAGVHQGGLILPGLTMMRNALSTGTNAIDRQNDLHLDNSNNLLGVDTATAVDFGSLTAVAALIEKVNVEMEQKLGASMAMTITGGDALRVLPYLSLSVNHQPQLVMQGLVQLRECSE